MLAPTTDAAAVLFSNSTREQIVTICLGTEAFGLPIAQVESIVRWEPLTHLPQMPRFVAGLYNLRGRAVPALDLRVRLELPAESCGLQHRIVMAQLNGMLIGLIVDAVREVVWVERAQFESQIVLISDAAGSAYLHGVANLPQGFVILLNLQGLLSLPERGILDKLQQRANAI